MALPLSASPVNKQPSSLCLGSSPLFAEASPIPSWLTRDWAAAAGPSPSFFLSPASCTRFPLSFTSNQGDGLDRPSGGLFGASFPSAHALRLSAHRRVCRRWDDPPASSQVAQCCPLSLLARVPTFFESLAAAQCSASCSCVCAVTSACSHSRESSPLSLRADVFWDNVSDLDVLC